MKNWLLAALFVVTWNEYKLKQNFIMHRLADNNGQYIYNDKAACGSDAAVIYLEDGLYCQKFIDKWRIETTTHTVKLATQKDVDLFIGKDVPIMQHIDGIISKNAFNIQVKEEK